MISRASVFLLAVAASVEEGALAEHAFQRELPSGRRLCTSFMESEKTGKPTCWVENNGWYQCTGVDETQCKAMCPNAASLAKQCTATANKKDDKAAADTSKEKDDKESDAGKGGKTAGSNSFQHTWKGALKTRTYEMVKPKTGNPSGMVLVLQPDSGHCGTLSSLAQSNCILVVCPFASGGWKTTHQSGDSEDADFLAKLATSLTASENVPGGKVIITGFSAGGSMAVRVICERSDAVGGIVLMGQSYFEPAGGHVPKGQESQNMTATQQAIQLSNTARNGANKCDPKPKRPLYALVGTADSYYGENGNGVYSGKALWEYYSTNVLGCTGQVLSSTVSESQAITGKTGSTCYHYSSCPGLNKSSENQYCSVKGFGHETSGWEVIVAKAFTDFFAAGTASSSSCTTSSATGMTPGASSLVLVLTILSIRVLSVYN